MNLLPSEWVILNPQNDNYGRPAGGTENMVSRQNCEPSESRMSKPVIVNKAILAVRGKFGLPDKITSDLEERLRQVDWNKLLYPAASRPEFK
jgi:hypothetical protein